MKRVLGMFFTIVALGLSMSAQNTLPEKPKDEQPLSFYKLEFVLRELQDGKVVNTRNYMMTIRNNEWGRTKAGARVPIKTGDTMQYLDIGVNIECMVVDRNEYVSLSTTIEVSSFALSEQAPTLSDLPPVLRQFRTSMAAVVPINKQTVIGTIDDANSTKRYEIAVTATKMK